MAVKESCQELREQLKAAQARIHDLENRVCKGMVPGPEAVRMRAMSQAAHDAMIMVDSVDRILFWNAAAERMFGYKAADVLGKPMHPLICLPKDQEAAARGMERFAKSGTGPALCSIVEFQAVRRDGTVFPVERSVAPFSVDGEWFAVGSLRDITERKQTEEQLRLLATTDGLTNLLNRRRFLELAENELHRAKRFGQPIAMLMVDVDRFKSINDTYGHDLGDQVLMLLSRAMEKALRTVDILGRVGGEEFAAMLPETDLEGGIRAGERLRLAVESLDLPEKELRFTVSVGVSCRCASNPSVGEMLRAADKALYQAKDKGRNRVEANPEENV